MLLKIIGPLGHQEELAIDTFGLSLGALLGDSKVHLVRINQRPERDWRSYVPRRGDVVEAEFQAADFGISAAITASIVGATGVAAGGTAAGIIGGVISAIVGLTISMALSGIVRALTPKPKKPKLDSNGQEAFGISGFQNTTGRGTPAFVPYGRNRIFGHVISSGATLSPDGKTMRGRVLYFMGDTGGDGVDSISDIRIDGTASDQYPEVSFHTRSGLDVQPVISEFENRDNLFTDGRALAFDPENPAATTPIIYTTRGDDVNRATLFISFPSGLYRVGDTGKHRTAGVNQTIEFRPNSGGPWVDTGTAEWFEMITSGIFKTYEINFPSAGKWDIRITTVAFVNWAFGEAFVGTSNLFNVQETVFTTKTYPGWALLGLTDIPAEKVRSLETINVSAMVDGKRVKCPQVGGGAILQFTRQRCWIVRDMMTHPRVGMGSEIDESEIDDDQWRLDSQAYYDESVAGHSGLEPRDLCDVVINDSDWDWEWVKKVAGEARGRIIPSGDKWKYIIDKPGAANILYAEGANIIENSITIELAPPDKPFTEITGQFRDADKDYEDNFTPAIIDPEAVSVVQEQFSYVTLTRESEVQRENRIIFKRNFLEKRRWQFSSPTNAIVSEPMDLDYIAERGIGNVGAYSGFVGIGSTVDTLVLPEPIIIDALHTYAAIIKHAADNTTEYRLVLTGPGTWGAIAVTTPFVQAPAEGDIYSVGIENIEHIVTRAQELEIDQDGHVRQVRTEYLPAVYTDDPLPPKSIRRFFGVVDNRLPIPLRDAQVREETAMNKDGSIRSILIFDVTPGLQFNTDLCQGGSFTYLVLAPGEPDRDGYYATAQITVRTESRIVSTYVGASRVAIVSEPFTFAPVAGEPYQIQWLRFAVYGGFRVEQSDDNINFVNLSRVFDIHWETDGRGAGPGPVYFRFTPFSEQGAENTIALITRGIVVQGDLSAPAKPVNVGIYSHLRDVRVVVDMQRPVAEDFASVEVELWLNALDSGVLAEKARFGGSADKASSGVMRIECNFNMGAGLPGYPYGTVFWARARAKDYSDNPLEGTPEYTALQVDSPSPTILTGDPEATGGGSVGIPTGLTLSTGVQIDPVDGNPKVYLQGQWFPNIESSISHYEFQYQQVADAGTITAITVRIVYHPQVSSRDIGVVANTLYRGRVQAISLANQQSGFTDWVTITTARDTAAPGPPTIYGILGGFRLVSIFFTPPLDQDFACVQVFLSATNDLNTASFWGESALHSVQFVATALGDDTTYFFWLRSKDTSGNVGAFHTTQFDGTPAITKKIGPNDIVAENLITQSAQIANAIITDAHITSLAVDKLLAGTIQTVFGIGVGNAIFIHGPGGYIVVADGSSVVRAVLGKVGPNPGDYGLQIFGPSGALFHSITSGTQTAGRQDVNSTSFSVSICNANKSWFTGVFGVQNTSTVLTLRVTATGYRTISKTGPTPVTDSADFTISHSIGKTVMFSASLTGISGGSNNFVSATLLVHYW